MISLNGSPFKPLSSPANPIQGPNAIFIFDLRLEELLRDLPGFFVVNTPIGKKNGEHGSPEIYGFIWFPKLVFCVIISSRLKRYSPKWLRSFSTRGEKKTNL